MMNSNTMPTWPGWETVRLIGRGSFGAVYEIERDMLGEKEKAALKVITIPENDSEIETLRDEGYDDASITGTFKEHLKRIVAEYALMRKLNGNTNVVNCDDVRYVQHDDGFGWNIYIKMELLTPMKKALGKEISDGQVIRLGEDVCRALTLCKSHSIVHRDIKPDNIFVSETGDYKLGDFGIAKTIEKTSGGTKIGTYDYMAPEVYRGQAYGSAADIYSLGMVLYWLLNERRTPFLPLPPAIPSVTEKETSRIRRFDGEPLPTPAHGSEELKRIVLKACAYNPKDRYQSAEELLRDLETLNGSGEERGSVTPPARNETHKTYKHGTTEENDADPEPELSPTESVFDYPPPRPVPAAENTAPIIQGKPERTEEETAGAFDGESVADYEYEDNNTVGVFGHISQQPKIEKKNPRGIVASIAAILVLLVIGFVMIHNCSFGHDWGEPVYTWSAGNGSVTARRVCKRNSRHVEEETVRTTSSITKQPRFESIRLKQYTALFNNQAFSAQTKTEAVSALGYDTVVGSAIKFGRYEQDNNSSNGKEDIEWIVLKNEENRLLVISKYMLDCKPYNTESISVTWENCSLRRWLNDSFLNTAFSSDEKEQILTITGGVGKVLLYTPNPGYDTEDKVFLLSDAEVYELYASNEAKMCIPTEYAKAQGCRVFNTEGTSWWWLRSSGVHSNFAADILPDGSTHSLGNDVISEEGVRPALWIDLGS